jgi:hypothetical protein
MQGIGAGSIIRRTAEGRHECVTDEVAIEEPLEIRIRASAIATTMRTPGNDEELAAKVQAESDRLKMARMRSRQPGRYNGVKK